MTRRGWNSGAVVQPYSPLSEPIILWDARNWDGVSEIPNQGTLGTAPLIPNYNTPSAPSFNGQERYAFLQTPGFFPEGYDVTVDDWGGPFAESPVTVMAAVSAQLTVKVGALRPDVFSGSGSAFQGFSQTLLQQWVPPLQSNIHRFDVFGNSTVLIPSPNVVRHYFLAGDPNVVFFDSNQRDITHTLITFAVDFVHGGATVFEDAFGVNDVTPATRTYPGVGSGANLDTLAAAVGNVMRLYHRFDAIYLEQTANVRRPLTGGIGVHAIPGVQPMVFGVAVFRGEPSKEDLAYWRNFWFPPGQVEADLPYPNSVIVGNYDRTPGDPPATHTITVPANTYSVLCNITPSLAHFVRNPGINRVVIEVSCQPGDQVQLIAGNRGSRWQSDGGVGGNPDGGNAGINIFNGYYGLSGSGSSRVLLNGQLVAVIGGSGGGFGTTTTGDDVTGGFSGLGGGGPGPVGLSGARGGGASDPGGFGGSQTEGGEPGPGGFEPAVGSAGSALQGGSGFDASLTGSSGTLLGRPGGGGGWFGGGGAGSSVGGGSSGGGGGSSWIDDSVVELIMTEDVINNDYGFSANARNAIIQAFWGRKAAWTPRPMPAPIARSGDRDPTFNNGPASVIGVSFRIWAMALQPDGRIVIGGEFITARNETQNRIARLQSNGELDYGFNTGADIGVNGTVRAIALQPDGRILIGGAFTTARGAAQRSIARLNANGSIDTSFNSTFATEFNGQVNAIALQPDGRIVIGGAFTTGRGATLNRIARLNADGSLDTGFNGGSDPGVNGGVEAIALQPDGKIVIGGGFTTVGGVTQNRIARLNTDGSLDTTFNAGASVGVSGQVNAIVLQPDGKILIGGAFTAVRQVTFGAAGCARLEPDGSIDLSFVSSGIATVSTIAVDADGDVYVGFPDSTTAPRWIRKLSGANRSTDEWFNSHAVVVQGPGDCVTGDVRSIIVLPDSKLLVAGNFGQVAQDNAYITQNRITRLLITPNPSA